MVLMLTHNALYQSGVVLIPTPDLLPEFRNKIAFHLVNSLVDMYIYVCSLFIMSSLFQLLIYYQYLVQFICFTARYIHILRVFMSGRLFLILHMLLFYNDKLCIYICC